MFDCVTIGDIKRDTFIVVPHASVLCTLRDSGCQLCITSGEKIPVEAFVTQIAGSAANVAVGLAALGCTTTIVATLGDEDMHDDACRFLARRGVATTHVTHDATVQGNAAVVLTYQGQSTQFVHHGTQSYYLPTPFPATRSVHIGELGEGYAQLLDDLATAKKRSPFLLSCNPGVLQIAERSPALLDFLHMCDILFVNVEEARDLLRLGQQPASNDRLIDELLALGPATVVVTDGVRGAQGASAHGRASTPIYPGAAKESTGAGDAFATGVLAATLEGHPLATALRWGAINAAGAVSAVGPTRGLLDRATLLSRAESWNPSS